MVEKLTDKNLDLEEKIEQLNENIADLVRKSIVYSGSTQLGH